MQLMMMNVFGGSDVRSSHINGSDDDSGDDEAFDSIIPTHLGA